MATYKTTTLATYGANGPLVEQLSPEQIAVLAANYSAGFFDPAALANFTRIALNDINAAVQLAEQNQPQGAMLQMELTGLQGQAYRMGNAVNQQYQQGNLTIQGEVISPWPGQSQIAYPQDSNTLLLQWRKGIVWVWVLIFVLVALLGFAAYELVRSTNYTMQLKTVLQNHGIPIPTDTSGTGVPNPGTAIAKFFGWVLSHPLESGGIALAALAAPYVINDIARTREAVNQYRASEHGYFPGERS